MRSLIVIPHDTLYAPLYLQRITRALNEGCKKCDVAVCLAAEPGSLAKQISKRFRLYGPWQFLLFAALILSTRLLALVDRVVPLGRAYDIQAFCRRANLDCFHADGVNSPAFRDELAGRGVDVLVSIAVGEKYQAETLDAVAYPLNVHSSLLPRHQGIMGLFWAGFEGDAEAGVTVHRMSREFDKGPILGQVGFAVEPGDSLHGLYLKAVRHGGALVAETLAALSRGDCPERPQDAEAGSYHSFPGPGQGRAYRRAGKAFFTLTDVWTHR